MKCCFFEFEAKNGQKYCVAVKSEKFLIKNTINGTKLVELFKDFVEDSQKFSSYKEVSEEYILKHCQNGSHYISMAKAVLLNGSSDFLWIG